MKPTISWVVLAQLFVGVLAQQCSNTELIPNYEDVFKPELQRSHGSFLDLPGFTRSRCAASRPAPCCKIRVASTAQHLVLQVPPGPCVDNAREQSVAAQPSMAFLQDFPSNCPRFWRPFQHVPGQDAGMCHMLGLCFDVAVAVMRFGACALLHGMMVRRC